MARNVEIKAAVPDFVRATAALARLAPGPAVSLTQEDTLFRCARGRLKLRRLSVVAGELIHYERRDEAGPKASDYGLVPTAEPDRLRDVLGAACGIMGVVRKRRTVRMVGRTRVHLDEVEGLGHFGIQEDQLVSQAYVDLLAQTGSPPVR